MTLVTIPVELTFIHTAVYLVAYGSRLMPLRYIRKGMHNDEVHVLQVSAIGCFQIINSLPWWPFRHIYNPVLDLFFLVSPSPRAALLISLLDKALGMSRGILPCIGALFHSLRIALPFATKRAVLAAFATETDAIMLVATAIELRHRCRRCI